MGAPLAASGGQPAGLRGLLPATRCPEPVTYCIGVLPACTACTALQLGRLPTLYNADTGLFIMNSNRWTLPPAEIRQVRAGRQPFLACCLPACRSGRLQWKRFPATRRASAQSCLFFVLIQCWRSAMPSPAGCSTSLWLGSSPGTGGRGGSWVTPQRSGRYCCPVYGLLHLLACCSCFTISKHM